MQKKRREGILLVQEALGLSHDDRKRRSKRKVSKSNEVRKRGAKPMKLKKRRLGKSRHPVGMGRERIIKKIEELTLSIDRWARVIPGRFFRCKATEQIVEIIPNSQNLKTLFVKLKAKKIFQRLKIDCSTIGSAKEIMKSINEGLKSNH